MKRGQYFLEMGFVQNEKGEWVNPNKNIYEYKSNAEWTKLDDTTSDTHDNPETAHAICKRLLIEYSKHTPCRLRGVCIKAWVTKEIKE